VLRQSGARVVICAREHKGSDYSGMVEEVRGGLSALERVVVLDGGDWAELLAGADAVSPDQLEERQATLSADDPINLQYTSGTTGFPKGATLSHHNILNNGYFVGEYCRYSEQDRVCIPVPFYHCFGMVMGNLGCTSHGACMVIPAEAFEPAATLRAVQDERCTSLYGVPTMFIAELGLPDFGDYDLSSLRTGIMAGSPCPVEVMRRVVSQMHMEEVSICYGMTETSPVSTQTSPDDELDRRVGTVGRVHPHVEVKIVDPATGRTLTRGESGELCTRGYSVMLGYWEDPERTSEAIDAARWMHTGDLATMDEEGYVNIVGRSKDMIIRGGENVYPREIEEFLYAHEDVADVQVIGVPDERYGEAVMAYVKLREGAAVDGEALRQHCRERIAHYKVPKYVEALDEFPMTVTGKIQKYKLRERAIETLGLSAEQTA
jgi:fatty-acyl-CoA synthase